MAKPKRKTCLICRTRLEQPATGRPRVYCGQACKRAAEYEIRRAQSLLLAAEKAELRYRGEWLTGPEWSANGARKAAHYWDLEAAKLRERLRTLLAGQSPEEGSADA
jgi:hypothetical protein